MYSSGQKGKEQVIALLFHGGLALFKKNCCLEILHSKFNEEFEVSGHQEKIITKQNKTKENKTKGPVTINKRKREREFVKGETLIHNLCSRLGSLVWQTMK